MGTRDTMAEADTRSEAEQLRSSYYYHNQWHATNSAELPTHRGLLLERIEASEGRLAEQTAKKTDLKRKLDRAQAAYNTASADAQTTETNLKIYKLALADQMEIPK